MLRPFLLALLAVAASAPEALAQGPCAGVHVSAYHPSGDHAGTSVELYTTEAWEAGDIIEPAYALVTDSAGDAEFGPMAVGEYVALASRNGFDAPLARFSCLSATHSRLHLALAQVQESSPSPSASPADCPPLPEASTAEDVRCAVDAGADVHDIVDEDDGTTVLHRLVSWAEPGAVRALLEAGAEVDARDSDGLTPLMVAAGYGGGSAETLQILMDAGADVHATDEAGNTPLHWAARWDALDAATLLLEAGADPDAVMEMFGYTPLHSAFLFSVEAATVPLLLEAGADPRATTGNGRTVLDTAEEMMDSEYTDQAAALAALRAALGE